MVNPIRLELTDLVSLNSYANFLEIPKNKNNTFYGFGSDKSIFKSRGLNFQEVRQYQPGDDIRQIDWRVTAKYGKPFTKLYCEEKEKQIHIVCDLREEMHFASHGHFKSVVAGRLSSLIGFLSEKKNDLLSYQILFDKISQSDKIMSSKEVLPHFLNQLSQKNHPKNSNIKFNKIIPFMEQNIRPGSLIFLLSDFHDTTIDVLNFLGELSRKNTITLIHIYDNIEIALPKGILPFSNGHKNILLDTNSQIFQKNFNDSWNQHITLLQKNIQKYCLNYLSISTDSNYLSKFQKFCLGDL